MKFLGIFSFRQDTEKPIQPTPTIEEQLLTKIELTIEDSSIFVGPEDAASICQALEQGTPKILSVYPYSFRYPSLFNRNLPILMCSGRYRDKPKQLVISHVVAINTPRYHDVITNWPEIHDYLLSENEL